MILTTGQIIGGHYEVVSRLGGGGFGETYLSKDVHLPDRPTRVIKRLCPRIQEANVLQLSRRLFETEAQVLYRLGTHSQIPQLFAHFEELSEFYLVQEYIDGQDLSHELLRGKIWEQFAVVSLLQSLLKVLSFIHQNNVIHRDIKPENIIRRRDGQLFLIDFGIVKQIATPTGLSNGLATGQTVAEYTVGVGTPGYMPSEQAHGEPKFASDIYAIGMIGIQALTGISPSHLVKDEDLEIIWRQQAPKVYPEFADILSQMIRFDFRQRYLTADAAYNAIQEFADRYPISINHSLPTIPITDSLTDHHRHLDPSFKTSLIGDRPAIPETQVQKSQSRISKILSDVQPWHWGLGLITLGAIAVTTIVLTTGVPSKSPINNFAEPIKERPTSTSNIVQAVPTESGTSSTTTFLKDLSGSDIVYSVAISPDRSIIAGGTSEQNIELWDFATGKKLQTLKGNTGRVYDIYFSPDGKKLVSASDDRKVIIWEVKTGRILNTLIAHQERVYTAIFSPDGKLIASSGADRTIRLWNVETGKLVNTLQEKSWVYDVSFTPDGKTLASANKDGSIRLWNVETGEVSKTLLESGSSVRSIVYSNDGKLIATGMEDSTVRLWDALTGQLKDVLTGHTEGVHTLDFSKDDHWLASGSADKTVRIWSLKEKRSPQVLSNHEKGVSSVEFSPDQKFLVSGSLDGKVKIWKLGK